MDLMSENHYKEYGLFTFMEARKSAIKTMVLKVLRVVVLKIKNDHRSNFSNLSSWKEEA